MALSRRSLLKAGGLATGVALGTWGLEQARESAPTLLRPPGADPESNVLSACIRCGLCVEACPTQVLHLAHGEAGIASGTPYLVARDKPCNLCQGHEEMQCIARCPTAALAPIARWEDVAMGTAVIDHATCLAWLGVTCRACWHACPFPGGAIDLDQRGRPRIVDETCVGCGLCEHACLTEDPAVRIRPAATMREDSTQPGASER